jgi:hypothetical protein
MVVQSSGGPFDHAVDAFQVHVEPHPCPEVDPAPGYCVYRVNAPQERFGHTLPLWSSQRTKDGFPVLLRFLRISDILGQTEHHSEILIVLRGTRIAKPAGANSDKVARLWVGKNVCWWDVVIGQVF